ncbi:MAG: hypothetical protein FWG79_04990 [Bacteroidales bacterium]|nr:hypothetical protein [Bacteroidales bacterium]
MKPKNQKTLLLGIVASLCLAVECQKEEFFETLPPETQTGANTFGCYVNGELFVMNPNAIMFAASRTLYNRETEILDIFINTGLLTGDGQMRLLIDGSLEGRSIFLTAYFSPSGTHLSCPGFAYEKCGSVNITRFDTINRIVSGTFNFIGRCARGFNTNQIEYVGDSIVHITEGRFDIKFEIK